MYICRVCISHGVAGMSNCSFCFPPPSAVGKGTEVCPGPLAVHATIQQEEVCLGTAGRSPRYVHVYIYTHAQYSGANFVHMCIQCTFHIT